MRRQSRALDQLFQ
jgi:hypothetical protein